MPTFLEVIKDQSGVERVLGNVAVPEVARRVRYAVALPDVPESQWVEFSLTDPTPVKDQGSYGACNGHAAASSLELARYLAGQPTVELSAWMPYAILCNGVDRGSNIGEALDLLTKTGTCLDSAVKHGTINPRKLSEEARAQAVRFRIEIGAKLESFHDLLVATQLRRPFNFSVAVGRQFTDLDAEGVCPVRKGATGNHAIAGGYGCKRARDGRWLIKFKNSWTTAFGQDGYGWLDATAIDNQRWFEAYCVLAVSEDSGDDSTPPPAPEK
jgi:hypothetical protein